MYVWPPSDILGGHLNILRATYYHQLPIKSFETMSLSHWYPGSGVVLDCIDS